MPRLKWIDDRDARGETAEAFEEVRKLFGGRVDDVVRCFSLRPDLMRMTARLFKAGHYTSGSLNRRQKEMIATYVSAINECRH